MLRAFASSLYHAYNHHLAARPLATKIVTGTVGMIISDAIAQLASWPRRTSLRAGQSKDEAPRATYDFQRTARLCAWAIFIGTPLTHYWFTLLDVSILPSRASSLYAALTKVAIDQIFMTPFSLCLFFMSMKTLEGEPHLAVADTRAKLLPAMLTAYSVWPIANLVNFLWVHRDQRILYVNCINAEARLLRVHYIRKDHDVQGWGLHVWGAASYHTEWMKPLPPSGLEESVGSVYWDLPILPVDGAVVGLMVHKGEAKAARAEVAIPEGTDEVWLVGNEQTAFLTQPDLHDVPAGSITKQAAIWVDANTIAWRHPLEDGPGQPRSFKLHYSRDARMAVVGSGLTGVDETFALAPGSRSLPADLEKKYPYLKGCSTLRVPQEAVDQAARLVQGQLMVSMAGPHGEALDATGLQLQGLLDCTCAYDGPLGYQPAPGGGGEVAVWAPTAQKVELLHFPGPRGGQPEVLPMTAGGKGVWSLPVPADWYGTYYKYRVTVYCCWTQKIEVTEATDPYSVSLAADGERSQAQIDFGLTTIFKSGPNDTFMGRKFLDIASPVVAPPGWSKDVSPPLFQWTDISIYELHIRDFSISDTTVPERLRGKYLAFSPQHVAEASGQPASASGTAPTAGLKHLANLRAAGLNHLHLLPTYDFGSVPEREEEQAKIKEDLSSHPPASEYQQACVSSIADQDGFNWGYDPVHWGVPDGSYATNPDGPQRIVEFRQMVMALHQAGWRVVLDVVYNHTFRNGPHDRYSVIDKIVPGYYHRRMEDGEVCQSTCCNNTAGENYMCERLMVEDIVLWAKHYRVDGFRFDIMGHLLISTLAKMRKALDALTLEKDGVDGSNIYIYGEAWDFGEMVDNQRGLNCGQMNLAGTGLGAFNDRLRDGALGGGPFAPYYFQGLVTGLAMAPNGVNPQQGGGDPAKQLRELLELSDMVRYSLAGNLRAFPLETADGVVRTGGEAQVHDLPLAYGALPHEHVAFIGCHDNQTIFDQITEKSSLMATAKERMRMCAMCLSLIALSQGVVFFHAGDDLLRSKSLDRDSYNSGDHFNRVDWTGQDNNFGVGLPVSSKNGNNWHYKRALLANPMLKPTPAQIQAATQIFQLMLRIRYSSPLFRLAKTEDIVRQVSFINTGPDQLPGVVAMQLVSSDQLPAGGSGVLDPAFKRVLVVFNCSPLQQELVVPPPGAGASWVLHPLQAAFAADERVRTGGRVEGGQVVVLPRTTAVFVEMR